MQLVLNDDQAMLARTALEFVAKNAPAARVRAVRDTEAGFDPAIWRQMVGLGWTAIPFAEADGGLGLGLAEVVCVTEALGRGLMTEPYLSNVLLAGGLLAAAGTKEQKAHLLAPLIAGEKHVALAHVESHSRFDPLAVELRAEPTSAGHRLSGEKAHVLGGNVAEHVPRRGPDVRLARRRQGSVALRRPARRGGAAGRPAAARGRGARGGRTPREGRGAAVGAARTARRGRSAP